jgi:hypothetical protein
VCLAADGVAGLGDLVDGSLDGVFHDGHAAMDSIFDELELFEDEDIDLAAGTLPFFLGGAEDLLAEHAGFGDDAVLGNEIIGTITGDLQDARAFILGFADDPLALADDALGLADFVGNGGPELVDEVEEVVFLNHDSPAEGNPFANADEFFDSVDKIDDVGRPILLRCCPAL